jgi:hypothetical protein
LGVFSSNRILFFGLVFLFLNRRKSFLRTVYHTLRVQNGLSYSSSYFVFLSYLRTRLLKWTDGKISYFACLFIVSVHEYYSRPMKKTGPYYKKEDSGDKIGINTN